MDPVSAIGSVVANAVEAGVGTAAVSAVAPIVESAAQAGTEIAAPIVTSTAESVIASGITEAASLESIAKSSGVHNALVSLGNESEILPIGIKVEAKPVSPRVESTNTAIPLEEKTNIVENISSRSLDNISVDSGDPKQDFRIPKEQFSGGRIPPKEPPPKNFGSNANEFGDDEPVRRVSGETITEEKDKFQANEGDRIDENTTRRENPSFQSQEPNNQAEARQKDPYEEFFESRRKAGKSYEQIFEEIRANPSKELMEKLKDKLIEKLLKELMEKKKNEAEQARLRREMAKMKKQMRQLVESQKDLVREMRKMRQEETYQTQDLQKAA